MSNNRMYLVYRPTGHGVFLGKHSLDEWHMIPEDLTARITNLLNEASAHWNETGDSLDDFAIAMETAMPPAPFVVTDWELLKPTELRPTSNLQPDQAESQPKTPKGVIELIVRAVEKKKKEEK